MMNIKTMYLEQQILLPLLLLLAIQVNPSKSTDKEFWINTVHLDGMTNINAGVKCDTCSQNTPLHPAETPPI